MNLDNSILNIEGIEFYIDVNLEKYTTMRLNKKGSIAIVKSIDSLESLLKKLKENKISYHLVGWGANQILHKTDKTLFIKLDFAFDREYLSKPREKYELPASVSLNILTSHAAKFGLKGWEVFTGIPASLGGAIFMNAGTNLGEIGELVESVQVLDENSEIKTIKIDSKSFSYRENHFLRPGEVILSATLFHKGIDETIKSKIKDYLNMRKTTQPLATRNCGCVFKNYDSEHRAGQFIDACGLKGLSLNGLKVSDLHANFIENNGESSTEDFLELVETLKYELELFSGIEFELEAKVY